MKEKRVINNIDTRHNGVTGNEKVKGL